MKRVRLVAPPAAVDPRQGTTLTEVLMSILCMGIGVVAVASLFPIAMLRSVQATQLTSATILRFNAETLVDLTPGLAFDPDLDGTANTGIGPYLIDPWGAMIVRTDEGRTIGAVDMVGSMERYDGLTIILDPTDPNDTINPAVPAFTKQEAEALVTLPDSWVTLYDDIVATTDAGRLYVEPESLTATDFTDIQNLITSAQSTGGEIRAVLFSETGNTSETRSLSEVANTTPVDAANRRIQWLNALPDHGDYANVSRIRIEVRETRYTWMLTVRDVRSEGRPGAYSALVDVVVFFRRSPSVIDETPYNLTEDINTRTYIVSKITATDPDPFLKKGGFMLDTANGKWHRLSKVNDETDTVTLERNVSSTLDGNQACFMQGVVEVYELGRKNFP